MLEAQAKYSPVGQSKMLRRRFLRFCFFTLSLLYKFAFRHRLALFAATVFPPLFLIPTLLSSRGSPALVPEVLRNAKRPLLVVAHPDDECLFFSPSVLGVIQLPTRSQVEKSLLDPAVLVLSNGNNYGIGDTRQRELVGSCRELGVAEDRCTVMNIPYVLGRNTHGRACYKRCTSSL